MKNHEFNGSARFNSQELMEKLAVSDLKMIESLKTTERDDELSDYNPNERHDSNMTDGEETNSKTV